jgi:hypothetical protein
MQAGIALLVVNVKPAEGELRTAMLTTNSIDYEGTLQPGPTTCGQSHPPLKGGDAVVLRVN